MSLPTAKEVAKHAGGRPPERTRVTVMKRAHRDHDAILVDVLWPKGWSLPEPGSTVSAGVLKGFVEYVEFDVDAQRILVVLR